MASVFVTQFRKRCSLLLAIWSLERCIEDHGLMDKSLTILCSISASSPFGCLGRHSMYVQVSSPSSDASPIPVLVFGTSHARHSYISKDPNFSFKEKTPSFCLALSLWRHRKIVWFLENCTAFSVCSLYLRDYIQPECSIIKLWCWNISSSLLASSFISFHYTT